MDRSHARPMSDGYAYPSYSRTAKDQHNRHSVALIPEGYSNVSLPPMPLVPPFHGSSPYHAYPIHSHLPPSGTVPTAYYPVPVTSHVASSYTDSQTAHSTPRSEFSTPSDSTANYPTYAPREQQQQQQEQQPIPAAQEQSIPAPNSQPPTKDSAYMISVTEVPSSHPTRTPFTQKAKTFLAWNFIGCAFLPTFLALIWYYQDTHNDVIYPIPHSLRLKYSGFIINLLAYAIGTGLTGNLASLAAVLANRQLQREGLVPESFYLGRMVTQGHAGAVVSYLTSLFRPKHYLSAVFAIMGLITIIASILAGMMFSLLPSGTGTLVGTTVGTVANCIQSETCIQSALAGVSQIAPDQVFTLYHECTRIDEGNVICGNDLRMDVGEYRPRTFVKVLDSDTWNISVQCFPTLGTCPPADGRLAWNAADDGTFCVHDLHLVNGVPTPTNPHSIKCSLSIRHLQHSIVTYTVGFTTLGGRETLLTSFSSGEPTTVGTDSIIGAAYMVLKIGIQNSTVLSDGPDGHEQDFVGSASTIASILSTAAAAESISYFSRVGQPTATTVGIFNPDEYVVILTDIGWGAVYVLMALCILTAFLSGVQILKGSPRSWELMADDKKLVGMVKEDGVAVGEKVRLTVAGKV